MENRNSSKTISNLSITFQKIVGIITCFNNLKQGDFMFNYFNTIIIFRN